MIKRKLIESMMPVEAINGEVKKEKTTRGGLPSSVHMWWSRRPMAVARSVIFASCVDDPAEHPELFPTENNQTKERQRLLELTEALCSVDSADNGALLSAAQKEIIRYIDGPLPVVFDPFAGGGAIPVEAQRLGLKAESSDLNPVAVMITKLVSDIPALFAGTMPVHPQQGTISGIKYDGARGYAEDVKYYGEWMLKEARKRIGHLYPKVISPESGRAVDATAWIWARTVKCPNPSCSCEIPLSASYDLARKKGREAWVEPYVEAGAVRFRIHRGSNTLGKGKPKVAKTAVFRCPACGEITPDAYVKECGTNHEIHSQLIAIVADEGKKRLYIEVISEHEDMAVVPKPTKVPHGALPEYPRRFSPPSFGMKDYADLFTNRQLTFLTTMVTLAREAQDKVEQAAIEAGMNDDGIALAEGGSGVLAYAEAVRMALVLTISKILDRCSNMCSWNSNEGGSLRNVFSRAAMPMIWDYAEANPFNVASGSFANALARTCDSIAQLPVSATGHTIAGDATMPNSVRSAMISTELPYYDKASYGDLSDFFYVWLRHGLHDVFPQYFHEDVTPKKEELTAFAYRWNGSRQQANAFYAKELGLAMKNLYESVTEEYPSAVAFQYKGNDTKADGSISEWETFVEAVCNAGFVITASWPLGRKYEATIELAESRGIPITVVLRKRQVDAPQTTRRNFVIALKRELPVIVGNLGNMVDIMDLRPSVIGQALNIFSRYSKVFDADGTLMRPLVASRIIEQAIDAILLPMYEDSKDAMRRR